MFSTSMKDLTLNEKKVLYGLIKYPDSPDAEVIKRISVNKSTYAVLKKKLEVVFVRRELEGAYPLTDAGVNERFLGGAQNDVQG